MSACGGPKWPTRFTRRRPRGEAIVFQDVYRDPARLGAGKKSLLFTLTLRSPDGTLTNDEADQIRARVVEACRQAHAAQLRA